MNKIIIALFAGIILAGCAGNIDNTNIRKEHLIQPQVESYSVFETELANKKDAALTIQQYWQNPMRTQLMEHNGDLIVWDCYFDAVLTPLDKLFMNPTYIQNSQCFQYKLIRNMNGGADVKYTDTSDNCILVRRKVTDESVCYFNYKKYMPVNRVIKTDSEFNKIAILYKTAIEYCNNPKDVEFTKSETEKCITDVNKFINDVAVGKGVLCKTKIPTEHKKYNDTMFESYIDFSAENKCISDKFKRLKVKPNRQ
ncbi:MAG: hypothetical protein LBE13_22320 [Bacteroidales bacterium]|jgi:hypothetical protein|nr:hypothetical protein [Bacteroidales bacterium]